MNIDENIEIEDIAGAQIVELYSKPNCPYCVRAKKFLEDRGGFTVMEISAVETREVLIERVEAITGSPPKTVPQIFIDGEYIGGYDDLVAHYKED